MEKRLDSLKGITLTQPKDPFDYSFQATVLGYHPFIKFSPLEYLTLLEIHGAWAFEQILARLNNPEDMRRPWAVRILGTADRLPRKELLEAENLYEFVTSSEPWRHNDEYKRNFWAVFFRVYKHIKSAHRMMPPDLRKAYKEDLVRWKRRLMEQNEKRKATPEYRPASTSIVPSQKTRKPEPVIVYKRKGADV